MDAMRMFRVETLCLGSAIARWPNPVSFKSQEFTNLERKWPAQYQEMKRLLGEQLIQESEVVVNARTSALDLKPRQKALLSVAWARLKRDRVALADSGSVAAATSQRGVTVVQIDQSLNKQNYQRPAANGTRLSPCITPSARYVALWDSDCNFDNSSRPPHQVVSQAFSA